MRKRRRRLVPPYPTLDPTLDVVFRYFFDEAEAADLLIDLLSAVLRPVVPIRRVTVLNPIRSGLDVDTKLAVLDLLVLLDDGRRVNVEMQCDSSRNIVERAIVYCARTQASAPGRGGSYGEVSPVVFVGILGFVALPGAPFHGVYRMREATTGEALTDLLEAHFIQLPLLGSLDATAATRQDSLVRWSRFLTARTDAERASVAEEAPIMRRATDRLSQLSSDPILQMLARKREDDLWLTEVGRRRSVEAARAEGVEQERAASRMVILDLLEAKFGTVNDATRALVTAADAATLTRVGIQTASASSLDELDFGAG